MKLEALKSERQKIFEKLKYFPEFYLVGGTALALQMGHRISVDFDLFSAKEIPVSLLGKVKKVFREFKIKAGTNHSKQLSIEVDKIKIDFVQYDFPLVLNLIEFKKVKLAQISEIAAMKAYALNRRGTLKDYIDLYFILKDRYATLEEIKEIAEKKYGDEFNFKLFLEQLIYLKDIKKESIQFLKGRVTERKLQEFFEEEIKKIKL